MNTPKQTLVRMAGRILRHLGRFSRPVPDDLIEAVHALLDDQESFRTAWNRLRKARERSWDAAAALVQPDLMYEAAQLQTRIERLLAYRDRARTEPPALRTVIAELEQLEQEFDEVTFLLRERQIVARTPSIELEGVYLGPFAIELHLDRLAGSPASHCFDIVALDPNPASCNHDVTHPHVQDKVLCAGDASGSIGQALKQGRIADAFCLVRSVLQTYNPHSPYVALDSWNGECCHDCDSTIDEDDACSCDHCEHRFCEHCMASCDLCDRSCCRGCIDVDPVSRQNCCPACRGICSECDRVVDNDSFNSETELCPECDRKRRETNKETEHEQEDSPLEPALAG
ncbi:MAG: hypothetical protein ABSH20_03735 [Tepidisphaeraceae bacterium]|jgi:hypothetical protein